MSYYNSLFYIEKPRPERMTRKSGLVWRETRYLKTEKFKKIFILLNKFLEIIEDHNKDSRENGFDPYYTKNACLALEKLLRNGLEKATKLLSEWEHNTMSPPVFREHYASYLDFVYEVMKATMQLTNLVPRVELIPLCQQIRNMRILIKDFDDLRHRFEVEYTSERRFKFIDPITKQCKTHINILKWEKVINDGFRQAYNYEKLGNVKYVKTLTPYEYEYVYEQAFKFNFWLTAKVKKFLSELEYIEIPVLFKS